jgi:hypothetical protein
MHEMIQILYRKIGESNVGWVESLAR